MRLRYFWAIVPLIAMSAKHHSFKEQQLSHERVLMAYMEKWNSGNAKMRAAGLDPYSCELFLRAFKFEEELEVWGKNKGGQDYHHITTYHFCENSGQLGPKRIEGDKQIPEGVYHISRFNPNSDWHLSLKINYPNRSDSVLSDRRLPGGQIYIHGGCKTIGCIPITDEWIKELYCMAVEVKDKGQEKIPVHIFPARLTDENIALLRKQYTDQALLGFWIQLRKGYELFEDTHRLPRVVISPKGEYFFFEAEFSE